MQNPEPPSTSPLQTVDVGADVDAVKITLEVESEVEVVAHIKSNKLLSLQTWEVALATHEMGSIYWTQPATLPELNLCPFLQNLEQGFTTQKRHNQTIGYPG